MASSQQLILGEGAGGVVQYKIERSLRFNPADSTYLNRTPGSAGDQQKWTWSGWYKVSTLGLNQYGLFSTRDGVTNNRLSIGLQSDNTLIVYGVSGGVEVISLTTTQVFRDVSAWYHIVIALDTTQATAANRCKVYLNGSQITAFSTANYPTQNANLPINQTSEHNIGQYALTGNYIAGYLTEINFINGQALTPSSFGQTNSATGVWEPKAYSGSYGTNGFYLNFSDNSNTTSTTLGKDYSGNGNNWTPNNFSVTAGAGNDSLVDTPTPYGTDTGAGGEVRGNYATLNPLRVTSGVNLANGNLAFANTANADKSSFSTIALTSGKWYAEVKYSAIPVGNVMVGVVYDDGELGAVSYPANRANGYAYDNSGLKYNNGTSASYGATWTTTNTIGIALDLDAGTLVFYKDGVSQGTAYSSLPSGKTWFFVFGSYGNTSGGDVNFGQRPFAYTAPSGFKALCTQNLPTPTIGATSATQAQKYFDTTLYTGNGSAGRVITTNLNEVGLAWVKIRSGADDHRLANIVTGGNKHLKSNTTEAESTSTNVIQAFSGATFTVGSDNSVNANTSTYVAWSWAGNGAGSTNTSGTISSTVSANTTAGFSIVTYTGNATQGATVGHGLGVTPAMLIVKSRSLATDWVVQHKSAGTAPSKLILNSTAAVTNSAPEWNNAGGTPTAFNSTVFTIGASGYSVNNSGETYLAYVFAEVAGYSAFGSYVGNGVGFVGYDGPFVYTGFRPRYLLIKVASGSTDMGAGKWCIYDAVRNPYNVTNLLLYANLSSAESNGSPYVDIDILSNGFKIRGGNFGEINGNGNTYIYAAFAEFPLKYTLAR